jgi:hypothetical protein
MPDSFLILPPVSHEASGQFAMHFDNSRIPFFHESWNPRKRGIPDQHRNCDLDRRPSSVAVPHPHVQTICHVERHIRIERADPGIDLHLFIVQIAGNSEATIFTVNESVE